MARICEICGKGTSMGNYRKLLRGHRNVTGRRTFKPNLQKTILDNRHLLVCTKCLKNLTRKAAKAAKSVPARAES